MILEKRDRVTNESFLHHHISPEEGNVNSNLIWQKNAPIFDGVNKRKMKLVRFKEQIVFSDKHLHALYISEHIKNIFLNCVRSPSQKQWCHHSGSRLFKQAYQCLLVISL